MATPAQIEANRRNAQKSTGPKTPEGRDRSRRNAVKHGLAARELLPEQDEAAARGRAEAWASTFRPADAWSRHLLERAAADSLRAERCAREESALRALAARRAELCWDDDRALDAEALGRSLPKRPAETKRLLERTPHGCAWLAARWGDLLRLLGTDHLPEVDRRSLAGDLLGLPPERRVGPGPLELPDADLADLARAEVARLEGRAALLSDLDGSERDLAECGLGSEAEKAVRRVRRYESACLRRMEQALSRLERLAGGRPEPEPAEAPALPPARTNPIAPPPPPARTNPIEPETPAISPLATLAAALPTPPPPDAPARTEPIPPRPSIGYMLTRSSEPVGGHYRAVLVSALAPPHPANRRERRALRAG